MSPDKTPDKKLLDILSRLLEKSRSGQVDWQEGEGPNEFVVPFSETQVTLAYVSPATEVDRIVVQVSRNDGRELWRLVIEEDEPGWSTAYNLFLEAKRRAVNLDDFLEQIDKEIGK